MSTIKIGSKAVGENQPPFFVADIAANHDGDLNRALALIELAKESGADAAKFQNFQAATIVSRHGFESLGKQLTHQSSWKKSVFEVYQNASLSYSWTVKLKQKCDEVGIEYFTSPYDFDSVDRVDPYVSVYKIGSGDISWPEIIDYIGRKGKPVMIASGASTLDDVKRAMGVLERSTKDIVLMQCNTNYTASLENFRYVNLNVLKLYAQTFPKVVLGLSDHTPGHSTVLGAIALGARVFEKHFTDDNNREGPDHKFAMNPPSWREMVDRARELDAALGDGVKRIEQNEEETAVVQRRSLRFKRDLPAGHIITHDDLFPLRPCPADSLHPYELDTVLGKKLVREVKEEECIRRADIAPSSGR